MSEPSAIEARLQTILAGVNDWLKFAEAKNAALVALDAGSLLALAGVLTADHSPGGALGIYLKVLAGSLTVSLLIALTSFLPVTRIPSMAGRRRRQQADSVLFFGAIAGTDPETYLARVYEAAGAQLADGGAETSCGGLTPTAMERDYARQIVVNSGITAAKFAYFTRATWVTLFGVVTPVVALIVFVAVRARDKRV